MTHFTGLQESMNFASLYAQKMNNDAVDIFQPNALQSQLGDIEDLIQHTQEDETKSSLNEKVRLLLNKLPQHVHSEIGQSIWEAAGRPNIYMYGDYHAADDLERLSSILDKQIKKAETKEQARPKKEEGKKSEVEQPKPMPDFELTPLQDALFDIENAVKELRKGPLDTLNRRLSALLATIPDRDMLGSITRRIWENAKRPDILEYGLYHAANDLPFFEKIIDEELRNTFK